MRGYVEDVYMCKGVDMPRMNRFSKLFVNNIVLISQHVQVCAKVHMCMCMQKYESYMHKLNR